MLNIILSAVGTNEPYPTRFPLHLDGFVIIHTKIWWVSSLHRNTPLALWGGVICDNLGVIGQPSRRSSSFKWFGGQTLKIDWNSQALFALKAILALEHAPSVPLTNLLLYFVACDFRMLFMIAIYTPVSSLGYTWSKRFNVWFCKKEKLTVLYCT